MSNLHVMDIDTPMSNLHVHMSNLHVIADKIDITRLPLHAVLISGSKSECKSLRAENTFYYSLASIDMNCQKHCLFLSLFVLAVMMRMVDSFL